MNLELNLLIKKKITLSKFLVYKLSQLSPCCVRNSSFYSYEPWKPANMPWYSFIVYLLFIGEKDKRTIPTGNDLDKVASCLKQLVRDWSEDGKQEREQSYYKIINKLCELYKVSERVIMLICFMNNH